MEGRFELLQEVSCAKKMRTPENKTKLILAWVKAMEQRKAAMKNENK